MKPSFNQLYYWRAFKMKKSTTAITADQINVVVASDESKSKRIVRLYEMGLDVRTIADAMGIRYNFAYNVLSNYTRVNDMMMPTNQTGPSKKDQIIEMIQAGKSNTDISKELKTNYNYVYQIAKAYLSTHTVAAQA
jgi:transposase-like protein